MFRRKFWFHKLNFRPSVELTQSGQVVTLTGEALRHMLSLAMYSPLYTYRPLATLYRDGYAGNTSQIVEIVNSWFAPYFTGKYDGANPYIDFMDGSTAYTCSDGEDVTDKDINYWFPFCRATMVLTQFNSIPYWSEHKVACSSWPARLRAKNTFDGPFGSPPAGLSLQGKPIDGVPNSPILFLANKLDPYATIKGADKMASLHRGSKVLKQDAIGHCALLSATSDCIKTSVADYLHTGVLPDVDECKADCAPWDQGRTCETPKERRPLPDIPHKLFPLGVE